MVNPDWTIGSEVIYRWIKDHNIESLLTDDDNVVRLLAKELVRLEMDEERWIQHICYLESCGPFERNVRK